MNSPPILAQVGQPESGRGLADPVGGQTAHRVIPVVMEVVLAALS